MSRNWYRVGGAPYEALPAFVAALRQSEATAALALEFGILTAARPIGNKAEAAYRRGDMFEKRRQMMAGWATWCVSGAAVGAEVTPIQVWA